jgi:hypothetical protein
VGGVVRAGARGRRRAGVDGGQGRPAGPGCTGPCPSPRRRPRARLLPLHPQPEARSHSRWRELCDPTAAEFAAAPAILAPDNATLLPADQEADWQSGQSASWRRLVEGASSPMCEMLGRRQRLWLRQRLAGPAPLKLVGSGSVLAGSVGHPEADGTSECDGDDWACWRPAQVGGQVGNGPGGRGLGRPGPRAAGAAGVGASAQVAAFVKGFARCGAAAADRAPLHPSPHPRLPSD